MRTTNNSSVSNISDDNEDFTWYVVYDTDTQEYLVEWDDYEGGSETWAALDLFGPDGAEEFNRFQYGSMAPTADAAKDLLLAAGEMLSERFPDEQINLVLQKVKVITARSLEVEDWGGIQTFGEDMDEEDEEVEELKPERRRDDWGYQDEEELEPEESAWEPLDPPEFPKPKKSKGSAKPKGSKKAKKTSRG